MIIMKNIILILAILMSLSFSSKAQVTQTLQPVSAVIYFDSIGNSQPNYHYGGVYQFRCTYDADGLLTLLNVESASEHWWYYRRHQYDYDTNHNLIRDKTSAAGYDYPPGAQFLKVNSYLNNLISGSANYDYDYHVGPPFWFMRDSSSYHYDDFGKLQEIDRYNRDTIHSTTIRYQYTKENEIIITTEKLIQGSWETVSRTTQSYTDNNHLFSNLVESCENNEFFKQTLVTYSYNEDGKPLYVLHQNWNGNAWVNEKSQDYIYDNSKNLSAHVIKEWKNSEFINARRTVYELNEDGYPIVVVFEKWNGYSWIEDAWQSDLFIYSENHLKRQNEHLCSSHIRRVEIHYAATPMPNYDVEEHPTKGAAFTTLYPNPTMGLVTITGQNLRFAKVINAIGQCVATANCEGKTIQIDIANLPTGVYFVNIIDNNGQKCVRKVVKE